MFVFKQKMAESFQLKNYFAVWDAFFLPSSPSFFFVFERKIQNNTFLFGSAKTAITNVCVCFCSVAAEQKNDNVEAIVMVEAS